MIRVRSSLLAVLLLLVAGVANASWYDDYDQGVAAARNGNWSVVLQKMNAALKGNAKEGNKVRTYGAIFINYKPLYYRGVAHLNLGNYEQAIADLDNAAGPGEIDLGSLDALLQRAKSKLAASAPQQQPDPTPPPRSTPQQTPPTTTVAPPVQTQPTAPSIDPALRQRAGAALNAARQKLASAQQRKATGTQQYAQATSTFAQANSRNAQARTNDDLEAVIAEAENAGLLADAAMAPTAAAAIPTPATPSRQQTAAQTVLADYEAQLRQALNSYFAGEFDDATRAFQDLSRKMPSNAWVWAFLGASQYSQYAFEADDGYRVAALSSFRKAKQLRSWKGGLPPKYFSRRIRKAFEN